MKLEPHLPAPLSSCLPPLPHASFPFSPPFLPFPLPCTPPPSVFPMDCLPIDSYCICTSLFIFPPPPPLTPLYISLFLSHFPTSILNTPDNLLPPPPSPYTTTLYTPLIFISST